VSVKNPTNPTPKLVGSERQRSRAVRSFLAGSLRFLRREVPIQSTGKGNLSAWILTFHGISQDEKSSNKFTIRQYDEKAFERLVEWMGKVVSPELDPKMIERAKAKSEELSEDTVHSLRQIPKEDVRNALDTILPEKAAQLLDVWGFPRELYQVRDISVGTVRQTLRAFRALAVSLQVHKTHVLTLIARASKGQRRAVLDLAQRPQFLGPTYEGTRISVQTEIESAASSVSSAAVHDRAVWSAASKNQARAVKYP